MKLAELRQASEINSNLIVSIANVLWRLQEALSICQDMLPSQQELKKIYYLYLLVYLMFHCEF